MRKICVVTGARSEYGLLRWLMDGINKKEELVLQIIVTGMHLSPEFGLTCHEIEADGFSIDKKLEMLLSSDTAVGITKSMGLGMIGFADAFEELEPDLVLLLGDRFEIFAAASAAMIACIPIAHLSGGETTEGAYDESIRHSITKMSHFHFVAAKEYRQRVIQLGEEPRNVFLVGGLGIDNIHRLDLLSREELEAEIGFKLGKRNLLVTFHPVTLEKGAAVRQMQELLSALEQLQDTHIIFTMPNADTEGRQLVKMVNEFTIDRHWVMASSSLGQLRYLSAISHVDGVVGNSSSGLSEVPSMNKGTVNIGDRQRGRLKASSVIDCEPVAADILKAIEKLYSTEFQLALTETENPYGDGGASEKIVKVLADVELSNVVKKHFHDIPYSECR